MAFLRNLTTGRFLFLFALRCFQSLKWELLIFFLTFFHGVTQKRGEEGISKLTNKSFWYALLCDVIKSCYV